MQVGKYEFNRFLLGSPPDSYRVPLNYSVSCIFRSNRPFCDYLNSLYRCSVPVTDQPHTLYIIPDERFGHHHGHKVNNLGNISPYHDAPTVPGVSADLPDDCTVDQVILVSSELPGIEPTSQSISTIDRSRTNALCLSPEIDSIRRVAVVSPSIPASGGAPPWVCALEYDVPMSFDLTATT